MNAMGTNQTGGFIVPVKGRALQLDYWPKLMVGITATGIFVPLLAGSDGTLQIGTGGTGGINLSPITQAASIKVPASTTQVIPIGAREWTITILTGTATFNGAAGLPAGFSDSGEAALVAAISITTDATSTAYVRWGN